MTRVCLIGAGFIAGIHAEILQSLPDTSVTAIVDPNPEAAQRLAGRFGVERIFDSVEAALRDAGFDAAHVLVPPPSHHLAALPVIEAGIPLLVEKPLAASAELATSLVERAAQTGAILGVNQNGLHYPAFARLRRAVAAGAIGNVRFLSCSFHMPLRQLAAGQFGHWMFDTPGNILLEQAVHPLSQIMILAGAIKQALPLAGAAAKISGSKSFYPSLNMSLECERFPAQFHFAVGEAFPQWQVTVVGDDGILTADMVANRFYADRRTRWVDPVDRAVSGWRTGASIIWESSRNLSDEVLAVLRLKSRSDPFFRGMYASIAAFHETLAAGARPECDGRFGAELVAACETIANLAYPTQMPAPTAALPAVARDAAEIAVLGGTGFIGRHLVAQLVAQGKRVSVMARSVRNLPETFENPNVTLHRGDIGDPAAVAEAIGDAAVVVNLAHGGGGSTWEQIRQGMVGGAETVALVCRQKGVRRLVHVGSIAALYLGPQREPVTGATPPDPLAEARADYSRAKALCDRMLLDRHAREGLPVVILRPGIVLGAGTSPFHSGLGVYNNDQHCLGWNDGRNPLPFVLVEDVATAIASACVAPGCEGRAFNLVGDVRLSAREFTAALAIGLGRPLYYHPQSPLRLWLIERGKWMIKLVGGRRAAAPSLRDLLSRGLRAGFDCSDAASVLGWKPVSDRATFLAHALPPTPASAQDAK